MSERLFQCWRLKQLLHLARSEMYADKHAYFETVNWLVYGSGGFSKSRQ